MIKTNSRVLLINNTPPYSGVGRYACALYNTFQRLGASHINFISWDKQLFDVIYKTCPWNINWLYYAIKLRLLASRLRGYFSLVHVANSGYLASIIPSLKGRSKATVVTVHDLIPMDVPDSLGHRIAGRAIANVSLADHAICISKYTRRRLLDTLDIAPDRVSVIYSGVDHSIFRPRDKIKARKKLSLPLDKRIILNVGSEERRKNMPTLLRAFSKLVKEDKVNAILVRVGERRTETIDTIRSLGLNDKVFYRVPSEKEIAFYYNAADVFVHPACYEGFGLPLLEALASGCPVVASNATAIPEVVSDAALLLDPFDVDGFAYWMHEVLMNEDLRAKLSRKGLERSMNFSWERCARETLEVYRKVLEEI